MLHWVRSMRPDPVLALLAAGGGFALAWIIAGGPWTQAVFWSTQAMMVSAYAFLSWQVAQASAVPSTRRFWRGCTVAALFLIAGALGQVINLARWGPSSVFSGAVHVPLLLTLTGVSWLICCMLTHPVSFRGHQRTRLWLDIATVMCGVMVFAWALYRTADSAAITATGVFLSVFGSALFLVSAFAMVRLVLSESAPFGAVTALLGSAASILLGLTIALDGLFAQLHDPRWGLAARVVPPVLLAMTPRVEQLRLRRKSSARTGRHADFAWLPYAAVAATLLLLIVQLLEKGTTARSWGTVVGVAAIIALVFVRQYLAYGDNARLVHQLDASMLDLSRQEQRFRFLVQHAADITILTDGNGTVTYASPALTRVVGVDPELALGRHLTDSLRPQCPRDLAELLTRLGSTPHGSLQSELEACHGDGSCRWLEVTATNLLDEPAVSGIVVNVRDVTEARTLADRMRYEATHDNLTGLANRNLLNLRMQGLAETTLPPADRVAVLLMDLDEFKAVNDAMGHHAGDRLLVAVAQRLRDAVRPADVVARFGGDEFVIVLWSGATPALATATAQRILEEISRDVVVDGRTLNPRASIGVAVGSIRQFDSLLREADTAMYAAKANHTRVNVSGGTGQVSTVPG